MTDTATGTATTANLITRDDLDRIDEIEQAAIDLWPIYAEAHHISKADRYDFQGLRYGEAIFQWHTYGSTDTETMSLTYLLDKEAVLASAAAARVEREADERRRREEATAAERARREAARLAQERADLATYRRIQDRIARGEITLDETKDR